MVCGDAIVDSAEACDDGNVTNHDGCSEDCTIVEPGFICPIPGNPCEWMGPDGCHGLLSFADPNLESVVRESVEIPTGDLYYSDVFAVNEIVARDAGIIDLDGLECLDALESLALHYNDITAVSPLASLTSLTELGLGFNQITDISALADLSTVTILRLQGNEISDLGPLSGLTALTHLDLAENPITDLGPLADLSALETLGLFDTPVSDLSPLAGLVALSDLQLGQSAVSDLGPLLANPDFAEGDSVSLYNTSIDCEEQAANIQALVDRGAHVASDCP
jgi:cysteine-rich repeat protein